MCLSTKGDCPPSRSRKAAERWLRIATSNYSLNLLISHQQRFQHGSNSPVGVSMCEEIQTRGCVRIPHWGLPNHADKRPQCGAGSQQSRTRKKPSQKKNVEVSKIAANQTKKGL